MWKTELNQTDQIVQKRLAEHIWQRPIAQIKSAQATTISKKWSNYEKLSFVMLGSSWGILVCVVTALHFGNSHLETKTSSTSGSHSLFKNN